MRHPRPIALAPLAATLLLFTNIAGAAGAWENDPLDPEVVALTWHKIANQPVDWERQAMFSPRLAGPPTFDRPDILKGEIARLQAIYNAGGPQKEFTTVVNDGIGQYDHARGKFPLSMFEPGTYIAVSYHYVEYRLVFANTDNLDSIPMPDKEEARAFDQKLQQFGRGVTHVIRFRIVGNSDPHGAVGGDRVMLAEVLSVKTYDRNGNVLLEPKVQPISNEPPRKFAVADVDVAGMRVGVDADELKAALERLYGGEVTRTDRAQNSRGIDSRYGGYLEIDLMTCMGGGYRRRGPQPGDVCVRAYFDKNEVIRTIIVLRVFPNMDYEVVRSAAIEHYGPAANVTGGTIGWGPTVDPGLLSYKLPNQGYALTMNYSGASDYMSSGDSTPKIVVALQLIDPGWAAKADK